MAAPAQATLIFEVETGVAVRLVTAAGAYGMVTSTRADMGDRSPPESADSTP